MKTQKIIKLFAEGILNLSKKEKELLVKGRALREDGQVQILTGICNITKTPKKDPMVFLNAQDGGYLAQFWRLYVPHLEVDHQGEVSLSLRKIKTIGEFYEQIQNVGEDADVAFTEFPSDDPKKRKAGIWTFQDYFFLLDKTLVRFKMGLKVIATGTTTDMYQILADKKKILNHAKTTLKIQLFSIEEKRWVEPGLYQKDLFENFLKKIARKNIFYLRPDLEKRLFPKLGIYLKKLLYAMRFST